MTLKQIAGRGRKLVLFLGLFADCFRRREARELLRVYVQGQLSDVHRKTAEGMALESGTAKSGDDTVGVGRQWNGNRGKLDNCVVGVHLSYAAPGFQGLLALRDHAPDGEAVSWQPSHPPPPSFGT